MAHPVADERDGALQRNGIGEHGGAGSGQLQRHDHGLGHGCVEHAADGAGESHGDAAHHLAEPDEFHLHGCSGWGEPPESDADDQ